MKPAHFPSSHPARAFPAFATLEARLAHAARLPLVRVENQAAAAAEDAPELTLPAAYEMLVSAACYLSVASPCRSATMLEASRMLQALSEQVLSQATQGAPHRVQSTETWERKQASWDRYRYIEAALRYVKAAAELRHEARAKRMRGKLAAWWRA